MPHALNDSQVSGSGRFDIYGHGGHLDHMTKTIFINLCFPFPRGLHIKFGFDWPSNFKEKDV